MVTSDYKEKEEKQLIKLAQAKDETAFEELIIRNEEYIRGWIKSYTKGNLEIEEEIFQQTLIKSWQRISQFKFKSTFKVWANAIARNNFYDDWRKRQRHEHKFVYISSDNSVLEHESTDGGHTASNAGKNLTIRNGEAHIKGIPVEGGGLIDMETPSKKRVDKDIKKSKIKLSTKLLDKLEPKHREVIILYEVDQLSYPEIAKLLHVPVGTIMSRLFYARKYLQRLGKKYR